MAQVNTRKRGSKWEYRFEIASVNGKRKQKTKGGYRTKKEALEAGTKALHEYNNSGFTFTQNDISVADYMDLWFEEYANLNYKYNTLLNYRGHIENHIKPKLGEYKLQSLTPAVIQKFINSLKLKGLSRSHSVGIFSTLSKALTYAVQPLMMIQFNPAKAVLIPKFEKKPKSRYVISVKDFNKILDRFPFSNQYHMPLLIGYMTGLRISEAFCLEWKDIDFENKTLTVNKSVYKRYLDEIKQSKTTGWYIGTPKTYSSIRTISLDDYTLKVLGDERKRQLENRLYYGEYYTKLYKKEEKDDKGNTIYKIIETDQNINLEKLDLIFVRENGEYTTPDSFKYCARIINHELKIDFNYHSLRHTHSTMLIENGANPIDVQHRLGHSTVDTTINTYTHRTDQMSQNTIEILSKVVHL